MDSEVQTYFIGKIKEYKEKKRMKGKWEKCERPPYLTDMNSESENLIGLVKKTEEPVQAAG